MPSGCACRAFGPTESLNALRQNCRSRSRCARRDSSFVIPERLRARPAPAHDAAGLPASKGPQVLRAVLEGRSANHLGRRESRQVTGRRECRDRCSRYPPAQNRAEHARIACARLLDETPDLISMEPECAGRFHSDYLGFDLFRLYAQMADSGSDPIEP